MAFLRCFREQMLDEKKNYGTCLIHPEIAVVIGQHMTYSVDIAGHVTIGFAVSICIERR